MDSFRYLSSFVGVLIYGIIFFSIIKRVRKMKQQSNERPMMNPYANNRGGAQIPQPNTFAQGRNNQSPFGSTNPMNQGNNFGTQNQGNPFCSSGPTNQGSVFGSQGQKKQSPFGATNQMNQGNLRGPQKRSSKKSPFGSTNPMSQGNQFGTTKDPFERNEGIKIKDIFCIFQRGEVDCGLDERIFGSKNQDRDVF